MIDDDVLEFIHSSIKSVWALELLIFLRQQAERAWSAEELVRELRSSQLIVRENLARFLSAGLVRAEADDTYRYSPAADQLDGVVRRLEAAYAERRMTVIRAILTAPNERLQTFSDAFKFKKD